jgi:MFS family permease
MTSYLTADSLRIAAITWFFFNEGATIGIWAALIPEVKQVHHISNTMLGIVLIGAVGGALLSMPVSAFCVGKFGSAISTLLGSLASGALMCIVGIDAPLWLLVVGMICLGFGVAWVDISANAQAVLLEKYMKDNKLGLCHGLYAVGGFVGALIGGGLSTTNLSLVTNFLLMYAAGIIPSILAYFYLFQYSEEKVINRSTSQAKDDEAMNQSLDEPIVASDSMIYSPLPNSETAPDNIEKQEEVSIEIGRSTNNTLPEAESNSRSLLIGLCLLGGLAYFGEGSIGDWSAIYLCDTLHATTLQGSFGFALFQVFVAIGRYYSDKIAKIYSRHRLLQASGVISAIGIAIVVVAPVFSDSIALYIAVLGFGVTGIGLSAVAPTVISVAGSIPNMEPADSIALVSSLTYAWLLLGPPLIGALSGVFGLRYALLVDGCMLSTIAIVATVLHRSLN